MYSPTHAQDIFATRQKPRTSFPGYANFMKRQDESLPLFGDIGQADEWRPTLILTLRLIFKRLRPVM